MTVDDADEEGEEPIYDQWNGDNGLDGEPLCETVSFELGVEAIEEELVLREPELGGGV